MRWTPQVWKIPLAIIFVIVSAYLAVQKINHKAMDMNMEAWLALVAIGLTLLLTLYNARKAHVIRLEQKNEKLEDVNIELRINSLEKVIKLKFDGLTAQNNSIIAQLERNEEKDARFEEKVDNNTSEIIALKGRVTNLEDKFA